MPYRDAAAPLLKAQDEDAAVRAGAESSVARATALHPTLALQRSIGNHAVQRLLSSERDAADRERDEVDGLARRLDGRRGMGDPLGAATRAFLEPRLGADLIAVRIHTDTGAQELTEAVSATAFASGNELYFRHGTYDPHSHAGLRLLAHEVTHVMQQSAGPVAGTPVEGGVSVSDPSDEFEREADRVADDVMAMPAIDVAADAPLEATNAGDGGVAVQREEDDDSWLGGLGSLVESAGSAVVSGAGSVLDAGAGVVSDVGSSVASGAGALWDAGSSAALSAASGAGALWDAGSSAVSDAESAVGNVASQAWSGAKGAAGDVADFGAGVYGQMKEDAKYVKKGASAVEGGIDWLEDEAKGGTHWLAQQAEGIPVLEQLAGGAESLVDFQVDVTGGALKGVTGMAGGLLGMAANPVDAAKGLYSMAEHIPGAGLPLKALHGAYDMAFSDKSAGTIADETLNPMADSKYWGTVGKGLWAPLQASIDAGKPGEALGNAGVQIAAMFTGAGEAGAAAEGAEVASLAGEAGEAGTAADVAELAEGADAAEAAEAAEAAGNVKIPREPSINPTGPTEMPPTEFPPDFFEKPQIPQVPKLPSIPEVPPGGFPEAPMQLGESPLAPRGTTAHAEGLGEQFQYEVRPEQPLPEVVRGRVPGGTSAAEWADDIEAGLSRGEEPIASDMGLVEDPMVDLQDREMLLGSEDAAAEGATADYAEAGLTERTPWEAPAEANPRPPESATTAEQLDWMRERFGTHVDEAIGNYTNESGLTPAQEAAVANDPSALSRFRGTQIDGLAKETIMQDPELADAITAPDFVGEPDILSANHPEWFDITTPGEWLKHVRKYGLRYGPNGVPFFTR